MQSAGKAIFCLENHTCRLLGCFWVVNSIHDLVRLLRFLTGITFLNSNDLTHSFPPSSAGKESPCSPSKTTNSLTSTYLNHLWVCLQQCPESSCSHQKPPTAQTSPQRFICHKQIYPGLCPALSPDPGAYLPGTVKCLRIRLSEAMTTENSLLSWREAQTPARTDYLSNSLPMERGRISTSHMPFLLTETSHLALQVRWPKPKTSCLSASSSSEFLHALALSARSIFTLWWKETGETMVLLLDDTRQNPSSNRSCSAALATDSSNKIHEIIHCLLNDWQMEAERCPKVRGAASYTALRHLVCQRNPQKDYLQTQPTLPTALIPKP